MDHVFRRLSWKELMDKAPVSAVLVVLNILVFIYGYVSEEFFGLSSLSYRAGLNSTLIDYYDEWWRILTSGFIHFDLIHILFNVGFGLYIISSGLERIIGSFRFGVLYFVSLIGSGVAVYLLEDPLTLTAGASGAIYGVMGALLFITLMRQDMISKFEASGIRNMIFINLAFTFIVSSVSLLGHLGGFATGLVLSFLLIGNDTSMIKDEQVYDYTDDDDSEDDWWVN